MVTAHQLNLLALISVIACWGALMRAEFPDDYPRYRLRVPQLVPGLRLVSMRRVASG